MEPITLVTNKRYKGKYVAMRSFKDRTVVASGLKPVEVMARAVKKGVQSPVLLFVPEKNTVNIY